MRRQNKKDSMPKLNMKDKDWKKQKKSLLNMQLNTQRLQPMRRKYKKDSMPKLKG